MARRLSGAALVGLIALACTSFFAAPATADTPAPADCVTACTSTFDTVLGAGLFTVPDGITSLTATVAGAAGAPPPVTITSDPSAVGGSGGVTTVDLGASYANEPIVFGVGGTGEGSYIQTPTTLLAVAGGGGGGGYAAYLDDAGQILATYPGGNGGAPSAPGVAPGASGAAFGSLAANGGGGTVAAGVAGTGDDNGTAGGATTITSFAGSILAAGGTGGTFTDTTTTITHHGGAGGSGYTGGGGGAISRNVPNGDVPADVVAPGGGGAGYLDASLTAQDEPFNTGGGYVSFTWSFTPTISTTTTTAHRGDAVPVTITGLPANEPFTVTFDGTTVVTGASDGSGDATESFVVGSGQVAGSFALSLVAGGDTVATSDPVTVIVVLAATGSANPILPGTLGALVILAGAAALILGSRREKKWALPGSNR
jgi:hypothetical protein